MLFHHLDLDIFTEMIASAFFVLTTVLAITKLGFGIHENETFGGCLPYNWSCTVCYNTLKVSLLKRDDNVRKLSEAFFPPKTNEPEIVEVIYSFGEDKVNQQIWFWTHDSSYLFFPIETFQYLSLFFGKPAAYFSQKVHLTLDLECSDVDHSLLLLLTQRVRNKPKNPRTTCTAPTSCMQIMGIAVQQPYRSKDASSS